MTPELFYKCDNAMAQKPYHYKECGLDNVFLANGYDLVEYDGEMNVRVENIDELWMAIGMKLVLERKTFTPKEIRFLRTQMDLTQAELGAYLRVDDQTVARWEKEKCKLPGPADIALRVLFLSSEVAQPQGGKILAKFHEKLRALIGMDAPTSDDICFFQRGDGWETRRLVAYV